MTAPTLTDQHEQALAARKPPNTRDALMRLLGRAFEGTPGRLRLLGVLSVLACVLFSVFAFASATTRSGALANAKADANQLVRIQTIHTNLVAADASLTNAFLVGGLEPAGERNAYQQGIATASKTLSEASGADASDAAVLADVNDVITSYSGLVESARSNNRQGFPVGAAYLRQAITLLHDKALPLLQSLAVSEHYRVDRAYAASAHAGYWLLAGLATALAVLLCSLIWVARRTKRVLNVGLAAAAVTVLVVGALLTGLMAWSQSKANRTRDGSYFATLELASTRIDAFDAKSAESLTLINRGSGQADEADFATLAANAALVLQDATDRGGAAEAAASHAFAAYTSVHKRIRAFDDGGNWDQAVALATAPIGNQDTANSTFAAFDRTSADALNAQVARVNSEVTSARSPLTWFGWIALLLGLAAAVAAWRGIADRLREYR
jgi:hypothetical protein